MIRDAADQRCTWGEGVLPEGGGGILGLGRLNWVAAPSPAREHKKTPREKNRAAGMEAQGIEPWSESASETASTCVGWNFCRRRGPVTGRPSRGLAPEDLAPRAGAPRRASPDFRFDTAAPGGLQMPKEREASLAQLTQPVPDRYWQVDLSKRFYQEPGPGHAAISSTNPSRPVAPSGA